MSKLSLTLSKYIGRQLLLGIAFAFVMISLLIFLVDLIELLRRAASRDSVGFTEVLHLAFLKLPGMMQILLPFAALFGAIWTISRMTRHHELIVMRAAGVSAWQFLIPAIALALALGIFAVTIFNPFASALNSRFEIMEARYFDKRTSLLSISRTGLWLRQADDNGQSVVHAERVSPNGLVFYKVSIFLFRDSDQFVSRIEAAQASLTPGKWILKDVSILRPEELGEKLDSLEVDTSLTIEEIRDSFASPETLSFWDLPSFIDTLVNAGFSAVRHRLHWHKLLSLPLLLCAMVLLAATFSLRHRRSGGMGMLVVSGVMTGFGYHFFADVIHAFALAGTLPLSLAAWTPVGICLLLGLTLLFYLEDG